MSRVSVAERAKLVRCSWRAALLRRLRAACSAHPLVRWPFSLRQDRPPADRAAGSAHRRRHARERDLRRPLRLRRQGGDLRRPLAVRDDAAVGGMGGRRCSASAGCAICAPPNPASPAPMRARWSTNGSRCRARWHPLAWRPEVAGAPHHLLAQPGAAGAARRRRALLPPLPAQPHRGRCATCAARAIDARDGVPRLQALIALTYAALCMAGQARHIRGATRATQRRARAADPARRRAYQPQSRRADRDCWSTCCRCAQAFTARNIAPPPALHQRHRPHDADAAFLPPRRRQFRAVQRHGADAGRPARHHARL